MAAGFLGMAKASSFGVLTLMVESLELLQERCARPFTEKKVDEEAKSANGSPREPE